MQSSGKIILRGNFKGSGFGFSCLHQASFLNVTGKFKYLNSDCVNITVSGSQTSLHEFHQWCLSQKEINSGNFIQIPETEKYKEFEISNQL